MYSNLNLALEHLNPTEWHKNYTFTKSSCEFDIHFTITPILEIHVMNINRISSLAYLHKSASN